MLKLMSIVLDDIVFLVRKKICVFFSAVAIKSYLIIAVGNLSLSDFGTYNPTVPLYFLNYDLLVFKP